MGGESQPLSRLSHPSSEVKKFQTLASYHSLTRPWALSVPCYEPNQRRTRTLASRLQNKYQKLTPKDSKRRRRLLSLHKFDFDPINSVPLSLSIIFLCLFILNRSLQALAFSSTVSIWALGSLQAGLRLLAMVDETGNESSDEALNAVPLGRLAVLYYGVGHMLNDITSACWFTYLLLFLTDIGLSPRDASIVMLSGQVADAFTTVFAGELIDRFGHFKIWHAGGSILVAISFSSVFGGCLPCKIYGISSSLLQTIGYSIFASIFNIGWAATQVSHMSMVNCITPNPTSRVALASCRNAFTMVANLSLYAVALVVFSIYGAKASADIKTQYRWIAYFCIFVGCCFVGIFLIGTNEPELKLQMKLERPTKIAWSHWFRKILYYQVAVVYMLIRLVTNVSQALLAFYVIDDLQMSHSSKAVVPGIIYICSFITSVILQEMRWSGWRLKIFFTAGAIVWIFCGVGVFILPSNMHNLMYILSVAIGIANALMMVTGISMQSILVGQDLNGCAFVYGSLSFLDKLSCGIALYVLESYQDPDRSTGPLSMRHGFSVNRYGLGLLPASCALLSALVTYSMDLSSGRSRPLIEPLLV